MGKSDNHISHLPEGTARPSLFGSSAPTDDHNIFDSIEGHTGASTASRQRRLIIWLLAPLLALAGWGVANQLQQRPDSASDARNAVVALAPATPALPSAPITPAESDTLADPFTTLQSGAVTALPPNKPTSSQAKPALDMQASLDKPTTAPAAETAARSTVTQETVKPAVRTSESRPAPPKSTAQKSPASGETKTAAKASGPAVTRPSTNDPDVELLSAIMKHLGDERRASGAPARSSQTIAELVKSCQGHDPIEALLCQRRICDGSWGKAQACPMNLAPKQTARAEVTPASN